MLSSEKDGRRAVFFLSGSDLDQFREFVQQEVALITQIIWLVAHGQHSHDLCIQIGQLLSDVIHILDCLGHKLVEAASSGHKLLRVSV